MGSRGHRPALARDAAPPAQRVPAHLAEPAARLGGLSPADGRHGRRATVRRRLPAGEQSQEPRAAGGAPPDDRTPAPVESATTMRELKDVIARWRAEGESIAMATVIRVDGSAPRGEGSKMLVTRSDRKSTRLNSSHPSISYAVFCLKKKK